jgi:hypothetical protein
MKLWCHLLLLLPRATTVVDGSVISLRSHFNNWSQNTRCYSQTIPPPLSLWRHSVVLWNPQTSICLALCSFCRHDAADPKAVAGEVLHSKQLWRVPELTVAVSFMHWWKLGFTFLYIKKCLRNPAEVWINMKGQIFSRLLFHLEIPYKVLFSYDSFNPIMVLIPLWIGWNHVFHPIPLWD